MNQDSRSNDKFEEITLADIINPLWKKRKLVFVTVTIFVAFGVVTYLLSEKKYTATSTFLPVFENSENSSINSLKSKLGNLSALAGIDFGNSPSMSFPPNLYPELLENVETQLSLLKAPLYLPEIRDTISYQTYYEEYYEESMLSKVIGNTIMLPFKLLGLLRGSDEAKSEDNVISQAFTLISEDEHELIERLSSEMRVLQSDNGDVSITVTMADPVLAAQMTKHVERELQKSLIDFKIKSTENEYTYLLNNYLEKKEVFYSIQERLASFRDKNRNLNTSASETELKRLESEYSLAFNLYNDLSLKLEEVKLKLANNKPQFIVIKPVTIPQKKSSSGLKTYVLIFLFIGVSVSTGIIFLPKIWKLIQY